MSWSTASMTTREALEAVLPQLRGRFVACANGHISRWACAIEDQDTNFYMIGSMGLASSIALGVALSLPGREVAVLDGDGNVLMNLGQLAAVGALRPAAFLHVVIDNGVYASTGDQPTLSTRVALESIAAAAGYVAVGRARDRDAIRDELSRLRRCVGPTMLLVETIPDPGPPAARIPWTPPEMTARVRRALAREPVGKAQR